MSSNTRSTNSTGGLTAQSTITGKQEYITSTNGVLNSGATLSGSAIPATGLSAAAAVQIVDGSGNQITSFGGGTQYTDGGSPPTHPIGPTLIWDSAGTWEHVSTAEPLPVTVISGGGSNSSVGSIGSTAPTSGTYVGMDNSGGNLAGLTSMGTSGDAQNGDKLLNTGLGIYNGATYDRLRAVGVATGTTGGGLLGVGILGFGGTNYNSLTTNSTTYSSKYGLDINLLGTLGTAFTTAGAVNVQGIAGGTTIPVTASIASAQTLATVTTVSAVTAITNALPAGTNLLGKVGIDQTTLGTTNNVSISASTGAGTSNLIKDDTSFGDGVTTGVASVAGRLWNGTNYDRMRSASTAANTTGTGLLGAGILGYDGTDWQYVGIDASHNLKVNVETAIPAGTNNIGIVSPAVAGTIYNGQSTATTSAVALASSQVLTQGVTIEALSTNTVSVFIGGSGVTTSTGIELPAGSSITLPVNNLNLVFIRCASSSPVVTYIGV